MKREGEFIFNDSGHHGASPHPGAKAVSHGARFQNVGQLLALAFRNRRWTARAVPFQDSLHPFFLPALQPLAYVGSMNFKDISDFGSCPTLHVESHGMKPVGHPIGSFPQGLLAESNQLLDFLDSSMKLYGSHATSCFFSDMLHYVVLFMPSAVTQNRPMRVT
jgi:hypothetical protein